MKKIRTYIKKIILESMKESEEDAHYMNSKIKKISDIDSCEELFEELKGITLGGFLPFNPPDPLRTVYREKIIEIMSTENSQKNRLRLNSYLKPLKGEYIPTPPLPPGAMY